MRVMDSRHINNMVKKATPNTASTKKMATSFAEQMSPQDAKRYNQFWDYAESGLRVEDRVKLSGWDYKPSGELYTKYKHVYDNPKYYDQINGQIHWPYCKC